MPADRITVLLQRPTEEAVDVMATVRLLQGSTIGDSGHHTLRHPLIDRERDALSWYVEEYWKWPYEGFAQRAHAVEQLLADVGKRLYQGVVGSTRIESDGLGEIAVISELPAVLSLPWELLHDGREFLALRAPSGVAITRATAPPSAKTPVPPIVPPVRVLLVTSRPEGTPFIDQRLVARPILERLQKQIDAGQVLLEFLRPPTLEKLHERLLRAPDIHVLHFDGHGVFRPGQGPHGGEGLLAFETEDGRAEFVEATILAKVLRNRRVQLAVLTACQSGIADPNDAFSSVAGQLVGGGVDAVVAMSGSVLAATAAIYVDAFYEAMAACNDPVRAHRHAQNALGRDSRRHLHQRRQDEVGTAVVLKDWWVPQLYTQRRITELGAELLKSPDRAQPSPALDASEQRRRSFVGRARELRNIERALLQGKVVVLHGLAGSGKSALAREAAEWLTRTALYERTCSVSFENGGTAASLLSAIAFHLDVRDGLFDPSDTAAAIERLRVALRDRPMVLIVDNLEPVLPSGDAPLGDVLRAELFGVFLAIAAIPGTGVLCTTRDPNLGDERLVAGHTVHFLPIGGLHPEDAYDLASSMLASLGIPRETIPYAALRDLLAQLDQHALAILLTVPALQNTPIAELRAEFELLLSKTGSSRRDASDAPVMTALDRCLQRLTPSQQTMLSRLAVFQGGASELMLAQISQLPAGPWRVLADVLENSGLLARERIHEKVSDVYLRFHPLLIPFIRGTYVVEDQDLVGRYLTAYVALSDHLYAHRFEDPDRLIALEGYELPNILRALDLAIDGDTELAHLLFDSVQDALVRRGMGRRLEELRHRLSQTSSPALPGDGSGVSQEDYLRDTTGGEHDLAAGNIEAAIGRFASLLERMEKVAPPGLRGKGSLEHTQTVANMARAQLASADLDHAERLLREAWLATSRLLDEKPDDRARRHQRATVLTDIAALHRQRGRHADAKAAYEDALEGYRDIDDAAGQAATLVNLAGLEDLEQNVTDAKRRALEARDLFERIGDRSGLAVALNTLGDLALNAGEYDDAEGHFRASLAIAEERQSPGGIAKSATALSIVARMTDKSEEAEGWLRYVLRSPRLPLSRQYVALANLALLLVDGVRQGRLSPGRLVDARQAARRALRMQRQLGNQSDIWKTLDALANIAELRGRAGIAASYRRREREAFAAFPGNRELVVATSGTFIAGLVRGIHDPRFRAMVTAPFSGSEGGRLLTGAIERIAAGERDWHGLASRLDPNTALMVLLILEAMSQHPAGAASGTSEISSTDDHDPGAP